MILNEKCISFQYTAKDDLSIKNQVQLNICNIHQTYSDQQVQQLFGPKEQQSYSRFHKEKRKKEIYWSRLMAKKSISQLNRNDDTNEGKPFSDIEISKGVFNNPIVKGLYNDFQVSITHCKDYAGAIAYPEELILGLDMESAGHSKERSIWEILTEREKRLLPLTMDKEIFTLMMWTAKEALVKLIKLGLSVHFDIMDIHQFKFEKDNCTITFRFFPSIEVFSTVENTFENTLIYSVAYPKDIQFKKIS